MGLRTEENRKRERKKNNNKKKKQERKGGRGGEKKDRAYCWLQRIHLRIAAYENNTTWSLVTSVASPRFIFQGIALPISPPSPDFLVFLTPPLSIIPPVLHAGIWIALHATGCIIIRPLYLWKLGWVIASRVCFCAQGGGGGIEEGGRKGGRGEIVKRD